MDTLTDADPAIWGTSARSRQADREAVYSVTQVMVGRAPYGVQSAANSKHSRRRHWVTFL